MRTVNNAVDAYHQRSLPVRVVLFFISLLTICHAW